MACIAVHISYFQLPHLVHTSIVTKLPTWTSVIFCVHLSIQFMYISIMTKLPTCYFLSPSTHSISITSILKYLHQTILFHSIIYYLEFAKQRRPKADYVGGMLFYNLLFRICKIAEAEIPQEPRYDPIWMFFTQPMIFLLRNRNPLNKELESAHIDFFE